MAANAGSVVVGTDFSEGAGLALHEGRRLAALLGSRLDVVHVADGTSGADWRALPGAAAWLAAAEVAVSDVVVRTGNAWVELARYVAEAAPVLVVVGSHGARGYQPLNMGSTSSRLSLHARCPVVIVSPRVSPTAELVQERKWSVASRADAVAVARGEPGDQ